MTLSDRGRGFLEKTSGVVAIGGVREVRPIRESQRFEIRPRRDARKLAEVGVHVGLIVVARSECERRERCSGPSGAEELERSPEANDRA